MTKPANARTFGQDLMPGEHKVGQSTGTAGLSYGVNAWVADKQNKGEIGGGLSGNSSGTSIFDPVLTELCYRWFCPPGGMILDPFAGGSVRGIVAAALDFRYTGIDLRPEQIEANRIQGNEIVPHNLPDWRIGDSRDIEIIAADIEADFVFSCPPYGDLERYSDDPRDLSTKTHDEFLAAYTDIVKGACDRLRNDRFACFVVGDFRDKRGMYRNFVGHTIDAFLDAGLHYYNEAILVTSVGSLPIRVGRQFESARKLGKTHQNILVFVKGDPKRATQEINQ